MYTSQCSKLRQPWSDMQLCVNKASGSQSNDKFSLKKSKEKQEQQCSVCPLWKQEEELMVFPLGSMEPKMSIFPSISNANECYFPQILHPLEANLVIQKEYCVVSALNWRDIYICARIFLNLPLVGVLNRQLSMIFYRASYVKTKD